MSGPKRWLRDRLHAYFAILGLFAVVNLFTISIPFQCSNMPWARLVDYLLGCSIFLHVAYGSIRAFYTGARAAQDGAYSLEHSIPIHPAHKAFIHSEHMLPSSQHKTDVRSCTLPLFYIDINNTASHYQHHPHYRLALSTLHNIPTNCLSTPQHYITLQQRTISLLTACKDHSNGFAAPGISCFS